MLFQYGILIHYKSFGKVFYMAKSKNNVYKPSKEALERHNARITKIEKESKRSEEDYVDTYLNDLKTGNDNSQKKKEVRKKVKSVNLTRGIKIGRCTFYYCLQ